jgi:hypothetical protein
MVKITVRKRRGRQFQRLTVKCTIIAIMHPLGIRVTRIEFPVFG